MSQSVVLLGLLYLALVLVLVWAIRRKKYRSRALSVQAAAPTTSPQQESGRLDHLKRCGLYWGVSVRTRENSPGCPQVREIADQGFPLDQAPELPLPGCDLDCHCHYQPLLEKRDGKLRRIHHERRNILRYEPDKRNRRQLPTRRD